MLGFIGLGVMGYPMAVNLLKKLDDGGILHVYDVSNQVLEKFEQEAPHLVVVCSSAREVSERSVQCQDSATPICTTDHGFRISFLQLSQKEVMSGVFISKKAMACYLRR
jgi:Fe2+ or Zn2+ uptake regulation protein